MRTFRYQVRAFLLIGLYILFSWIAVHFLSIFGIFLALGYPVLWLLMPKRTLCFVCRALREGQRCVLCRMNFIKSQGVYPKTFLSVFLNACVILIITFASVGIVFLESKFLESVGFTGGIKMASFSVLTGGEYRIGDIFPLRLDINGIKTSINAVRMDIQYDPAQIEVVDVSTSESFADIFIEKSIDNKQGFTRLSGGIPNPGFEGGNGTFATVYLRGLKTGKVRINFLPSSVVLANNGRGDNVLNETVPVTYLISPRRGADDNKSYSNSGTSTNVLSGKTSAKTQMIFYNEQRVLGAEVVQRLVEDSGSKGVIGEIPRVINSIDLLALSFWQKILLK